MGAVEGRALKLVVERKVDKIDPDEFDPLELLSQAAEAKAKEGIGLAAVGVLAVATLFGLVVDLASD